MENVNQTNPTQAKQDYFDSVMYARVYINDIRVVKVENGENYAALSASIIERDENGKKTYTPVELRANGEEVKAILREFREQWPVREDKESWIADINIGSIKDDLFYSKKYQCNKASMKGRLIHIRSLNVGGKVVLGEQDDFKNPVFVAKAYLHEIDMNEGIAKASFVDGKVEKPNYCTIQLNFNDIPVFNELNERGLRPRGYIYRKEDAVVYSIIEIESLQPEIYEYDGEDKSTFKGVLTKVRYLKAGSDVITCSITKESGQGSKEESVKAVA